MNRFQRAAAVLLGLKTASRSYAGARPSRLTAGLLTSTGSADTAIRSSLTNLRGRSRSLVRDAAYAKRAKSTIVNNVIGNGIGMQAQVMASRDHLRTSINDAIEELWAHCSSRPEYLHTGGVMAMPDMERSGIGEVFEAGEIFIREHYTAFGGSPVPYALEFIESERVPHEFQLQANSETRLGVEVDRYYRPQAYWIRERHPNDIQPGGTPTDNVVRVPASEIIHLQVVSRFPQTRGVPWMHAAIKTLNDMDGYVDAEITAARGAANYMGWLETSDLEDPNVDKMEDGSYESELQPGIIGRGPPGSQIKFHDPNRPNTGVDAFMRYMLRQAACAVDVPYESISGDYSQSNYSSSRLSLLDSRDQWRALQAWFIRTFRERVHRHWLQQAVFAGALPISVSEYVTQPEKFEAAKFRARGWGWVDPQKEIEAYKEGIRGGLTTQTEVLAGFGRDVEEVIEERKRELDLAAKAGVEFDTEPQPEVAPAAAPAKPKDEKEDEPEKDEEQERQLRAVK